MRSGRLVRTRQTKFRTTPVPPRAPPRERPPVPHPIASAHWSGECARESLLQGDADRTSAAACGSQPATVAPGRSSARCQRSFQRHSVTLGGSFDGWGGGAGIGVEPGCVPRDLSSSAFLVAPLRELQQNIPTWCRCLVSYHAAKPRCEEGNGHPREAAAVARTPSAGYAASIP